MFARNISASITSIHLYHVHSLPKSYQRDFKKEILPLFLLISRSSQETMSQNWQDTLHKRNSLLLSLCLSATMVTYLSMLTMTVIGVVWMLTSLRARSPRTLRLVPAKQGKGRGGARTLWLAPAKQGRGRGGARTLWLVPAKQGRGRGGARTLRLVPAKQGRGRGGARTLRLVPAKQGRGRGGARTLRLVPAKQGRGRGGGEKEHELRGVRQRKIDREGEERGNMRGGRQRKIDREWEERGNMRGVRQRKFDREGEERGNMNWEVAGRENSTERGNVKERMNSKVWRRKNSMKEKENKTKTKKLMKEKEKRGLNTSIGLSTYSLSLDKLTKSNNEKIVEKKHRSSGKSKSTTI